METKIESQELGLVMLFGLIKFHPQELYHHSVLMITTDGILAFDDMLIDLSDPASKTNYHKSRTQIHLSEIGFVTDEKLVGRKELKNYHRLTINSKDGNRALVFFYSKKEKKNAKKFLNQLKQLKVEVAKGKGNISI